MRMSRANGDVTREKRARSQLILTACYAHMAIWRYRENTTRIHFHSLAWFSTVHSAEAERAVDSCFVYIFGFSLRRGLALQTSQDEIRDAGLDDIGPRQCIRLLPQDAEVLSGVALGYSTRPEVPTQLLSWQLEAHNQDLWWVRPRIASPGESISSL